MLQEVTVLALDRVCSDTSAKEREALTFFSGK